MDEALLRILTPTVIGILVRRGADFAAAEEGRESMEKEGESGCPRRIGVQARNQHLRRGMRTEQRLRHVRLCRHAAVGQPLVAREGHDQSMHVRHVGRGG